MSFPRTDRAFGLVSVLFFGLLLWMLVLSVHFWSVQSLRRTSDRATMARCEHAARSGLQVGLSRLKANDAWSAPISDAMPDLSQVRYDVLFLNNTAGPATLAPDGTPVPAGAVYMVSVGRSGRLRFTAGALAIRGQSTSLFDYGLFSDGNISMSGTSAIRSWGPSLPSPLPFQTGTNGFSGGVVDMSGDSRIDGLLMVGPGGGPGSVSNSGSSSYGSLGVLTVPKTFTSYAAPATTGPLQAVSLSGTDQQDLAPGNYRRLSMSGDSQAVLTSGQYFFAQGISLSGSSRLVIQNPSGPVLILADNGLSQSGSSQINPGGNPSNLQVIVLGGSLSLSTDAGLRAGVYAPDSNASTSGDSRIIGALVARSVTMSGSSSILFDHSLAGGAASGPGQWRLTIVRADGNS
jgi:hypothetical protein